MSRGGSENRHGPRASQGKPGGSGQPGHRCHTLVQDPARAGDSGCAGRHKSRPHGQGPQALEGYPRRCRGEKLVGETVALDSPGGVVAHPVVQFHEKPIQVKIANS